jgi:uncharacterized protein YecE (DUF72 family)
LSKLYVEALAACFGTCGWSYQEWVGAFYPSNRVAKLPFYGRVFGSVEVDSSFYRTPSKSMVSGWAKATGPLFKFSLKMPKTITHDRKLLHAEKETGEFLEKLEPITRNDKMGCLLLQFPASFTFAEISNLESYLKLLPQDFRFAVEFRHESWDREETWSLLRKYNVANTITDSPLTFLSKPVITSTTHAYVRWHGRGKKVWYNYRYSEEELLKWKGVIEQIEDSVQNLYAYFNNHYGANAPSNLLTLLEMRGELSEEQAKVMKREQRLQARKQQAVAKLTDYL